MTNLSLRMKPLIMRKNQSAPGFHRRSSSSSSKRARQQEAIDHRSPPCSRKHKADTRPSYLHTQGVTPYFSYNVQKKILKIFSFVIYLWLFTSEAERSTGTEPVYRSRDMAYSNVAPIPLHKEQGQPKSYPDRSGTGPERRPPKSPKESA